MNVYSRKISKEQKDYRTTINRIEKKNQPTNQPESKNILMFAKSYNKLMLIKVYDCHDSFWLLVETMLLTSWYCQR
jgi:hypothetical protein